MSLRSASRACGLGALSWALLNATSAVAQEAKAPSVFDSIHLQVQSVFQKCRKAVVRVEATDSHGQLSGTGFFVDPNGTLYTSWGVGGEARDIVVCDGDAKYPARRLVADSRAGVAILKVDAAVQVPFIPVGSSQELTVASPIVTVGFPMDLPPTPSFGMVGGFDVKYLGRYFGTRHIRANVAVQRGEGGAPLLNLRGEAVGVLISSLDQGSASFVLPIEAAEKVRRDYVRFGEVRPGWMGLVVSEASAAVHGSTALVQEMMKTGPAAKAGVKEGDILLQVGDNPVTSPEDMLTASFYLTADDQVSLRVARGTETLDLKIQPTETPAMQRPLFPTLGTTERPSFAPLDLGQDQQKEPAK